MHSYSLPSPFEYSSKPIHAKVADAKLARGVAVLYPLADPLAIMKDVNRRMQTTKIGNNTILELLMKELNIPPLDRKIAKLKVDEIDNMDLASIKKLLPGSRELENLDFARATLRTKLITLQETIKFPGETAEEQLKNFKNFIKKNLLKNVKAEEKKDKLAEAFIHNFHQSGVIQALDSYIILKTGLIATSDPDFEQKLDSGTRVINLTNAEPMVTLTCHGNEISYDYALTYKSLNFLNKNTPEDPNASDSKPLAELKTKIRLGINEDNEVSLKTSDLHVKKRFLLNNKGKPLTMLNSFFAKLFDDPFSGKAGRELLNSQPKVENCEKDKLYIFFDKKGKLKYGALDKSGKTLLTANVPLDKMLQPKLNLGAVTTYDPLPKNIMQESENINRPLIIKRGGEFLIYSYSEKQGKWREKSLEPLQQQDRTILNKYVNNQPRSKAENISLFKLVAKHHPNPKDRGLAETLQHLKDFATDQTKPNEKQLKAWNTVCNAINDTQYTGTKPSRVKKAFSSLFIGRKPKGAANKVTSEDVISNDSKNTHRNKM